MKTFEGVGTSICTLVSPPPLPSFSFLLSTPRGLSRRRHFTHVDQLSETVPAGITIAKLITDVATQNTANIVKKENTLFTCVSVSLSEERGRWSCVSPLQWPTTGYRLNSGRPLTPTLRGRTLEVVAGLCHKTPGESVGMITTEHLSHPSAKAFPGASRRS